MGIEAYVRQNAAREIKRTLFKTAPFDMDTILLAYDVFSLYFPFGKSVELTGFAVELAHKFNITPKDAAWTMTIIKRVG